jgi:dihydrofolate reductase
MGEGRIAVHVRHRWDRERHRAGEAGRGDRNVGVGTASTFQQCLNAGLLDEIHIDLVPVLLGAGIRLFDNLATAPIDLIPYGGSVVKRAVW